MAVAKAVSANPIRGPYVTTVYTGRAVKASGRGYGLARLGGLQHARVQGLTAWPGTAAGTMLAAQPDHLVSQTPSDPEQAEQLRVQEHEEFKEKRQAAAAEAQKAAEKAESGEDAEDSEEAEDAEDDEDVKDSKDVEYSQQAEDKSDESEVE